MNLDPEFLQTVLGSLRDPPPNVGSRINEYLQEQFRLQEALSNNPQFFAALAQICGRMPNESPQCRSSAGYKLKASLNTQSVLPLSFSLAHGANSFG